jgi:serine/threonine protein kinase
MSHKNVVKFIGCCVGGSTLTLVTEYVPKGNLDDILHHSDIAIPLDIRLGIAIGCAEALSYMHSMHLSIDSLICHGDIKPANILLDDNFTAKVSDFGLSRLLLGGITQYASKVIGSIDYMDPVLMHTGRLTPRNDVYSFGIVLLELITRKRVKQGDMNLIGIFECAKGKGLRKLFDPSIANKNSIKTLEEIVELAMACLRLDIKNRPEMNHVEKRLRVLKRDLKCRQEQASSSILSTHHSWHTKDKQEKPQLKKSGSFFKRNASNAKIVSEFSNVTGFTKAELKEITDNYSHMLSGGMSAKFYKGRLEDNTVVAVRKFRDTDSQEAFINGGIVLSQIAHKNNIIKLLGCCLEAETLAFIYEYADKGSLLDILGSQEYLPLDLRLRIAIKTAEALQYLHSSATGIIGHGSVSASTVLLHNNFVPKLTDFSGASKLIMDSGSNAGDSVINSVLLEKVLDSDPSRYKTVLMNLESDVYRFGGVLLALVSRENNVSFDELIVEFTKAYQKDNSGKAMFDKDITAEQDIAALEEMGRLALRCTILNADEIAMRPTMQEVAEELRRIRRCWKLRTSEATPHVTETTATAAASLEPRLPNLMRHLFGYRRISITDPIRTS